MIQDQIHIFESISQSQIPNAIQKVNEDTQELSQVWILFNYLFIYLFIINIYVVYNNNNEKSLILLLNYFY